MEVYDSDPAKPHWSGVRYMISDTGSMNIVPQQARAHNARRIKDEIELDKVRAVVRTAPKV